VGFPDCGWAHFIHTQAMGAASDTRSARVVDRLLGRLSRRTTSGRYIPEVDGLRFVSILLVVLFHVRSVLGSLGAGHAPGFHGHGFFDGVLGQGQFGVELFFMISGFILALPFASHRLKGAPAPNVRRYYVRRLTRLEPPYLLALTACFILLPMVVPGASRVGLVPHYLAGSAYAHGLIFGNLNPVNPPTWSLEVEVQFYLLVPLLAMLFSAADPRVRRVRIVNVAIGGFAIGTFATRFFGFPELTLLSFFQYFLVGFLLADVYLTTWSSAPKQRRSWDVVSFLGWPALFAIAAWDQPAVTALCFPATAGLVFWAAFRGPVTRAILTNRWVTTIGGMCYSIYLIHYPLMVWLGRAVRPLLGGSFALNVVILVLILVPVVLLTSTILFAFVERPCMDPDWFTRLIRRARGIRRMPEAKRTMAIQTAVIEHGTAFVGEEI
jgi:peptidoglycan/LPS O-acetylase OafA/YrhL